MAASTNDKPLKKEDELSQIDELTQNINKLEEKHKKFKAGIGKDYDLLEEIVKDIAKQKNELKEVKEKIINNPKSTGKDKLALKNATESIGKLHIACVPETGSQFIRFFLGQVNVKQYREGERYVLKKEYEKFKNRTSIIFLVAVIVQMIFPINILQVLFQVWLLYYYVSLALRENILRVNGSAILPWYKL